MPTQQNLDLKRGRAFTFTGTAYKNGTAINLTGGTLRMTVKWDVNDADAAAVFQINSTASNANGSITLTSPTLGQFSVTVKPAATTSLPAHRLDLYWDLQYTPSGGDPVQLSEGTCYVTPNVTITTP